jgi:hypothetical protein
MVMFFSLPAPPQDHEPTISSTISFPICEPIFISPTSYRNSPMGPPPFIIFPRNFLPSLGHSFHTGAPVSVFCTSSPHLLIIFCTDCWVCVIFFARVVVSECLCRAHRGVRGAEPPARGFGGAAPEIFFLGRHIFASFRPTYYRRADIFSGRHISGTT